MTALLLRRTAYWIAFGAEIKRRRRETGLSQTVFGMEAFGFSNDRARRAISSIERGARRVDLWELRRLAYALGCAPINLFHSVPEPAGEITAS